MWPKIVFVLWGASAFFPDQEPARQVLSVCDVLRNPTTYAGSQVSIRGEIYYGLRSKEKCGKTIRSDGRQWPYALNIATDESALARIEKRPKGLHDPRPFFERVYQERQKRPVVATATLTGFIRARSNYEDGTPGYGHLGLYAAEIVVESVSDAVLVLDGKPIPWPE